MSRPPLVLALALLFAADVWGVAEVERIVIEHGHHKDMDFWVIVAFIVLAVAALIWVTIRIALRLLSTR